MSQGFVRLIVCHKVTVSTFNILLSRPTGCDLWLQGWKHHQFLLKGATLLHVICLFLEPNEPEAFSAERRPFVRYQVRCAEGPKQCGVSHFLILSCDSV